TNKGQSLMSLNGMGMEIMKQVITSSMGYATQQGQRQDLTGDALKEAQNEAKLFSDLDNLKNADSFELTGIETFNGEDVYVLKKDTTTSFYSVASGLKVAVTEAVEAQGQTFELTSTFVDYKDVKGVKIAHATSLPLGPGMSIDFKASEVKVNEGVTDADFK